MSENADWVKGCNGGTGEDGGTGEEETVPEALEISKRALPSNFTLNPDDELLSWLQYPLDDALFQHWPPPLTSPTPPAPPPSSSYLSTFLPSFSSPSSSSSSSSSSSCAVKYLPQLENEAFMAAKERVSVDDWILHREDTESEICQREQGGGLKNRGAVMGQEDFLGVKEHNEAYPWVHRGGDRRTGVWASRLFDCKQDSRKLAQLKLTPGDEEREGLAVASTCVAPSDKAIWVNRGDPHADTDMRFEAHITQNQEVLGLHRKAKAEEENVEAAENVARFTEAENVAGFPEEENVTRFIQVSNEECWLRKDIDKGQHADTDMMYTADDLPPNEEEGESLQRKGKAQEADVTQFAQVLMKDMDMEGSPITTGGRVLQAHSNADAALALGAGRAAGVIKSPGMAAFSKVRTSLQPTQLGSPPSSIFPLARTLSGQNLVSPAWKPIAPKPLGSSCTRTTPQPSYEVKLSNFAQLHVTQLSPGFSNMGFQEKGAHIKTSSSSLEPPPLLSPQEVGKATEGSQNVSIPEETMAGGSGGSSAVAASESDTTDMPKLSGVSFLSHERRMARTCSGGSQTSESLRETVSGAKRKLEDSECQSEEAEGDSVVSSQARTSSSKRPRANEVHNLSERRRRNRINDKMNALRDLIPNASKSNKAALLDEAIDYLKNLQLQLQVMSLRTGVSLLPMVLPPSVPHMQMPQYGSLSGMGMDMSRGSELTGAGSTMGIGMHNVYAVPARSFSNLVSASAPSSAEVRPLQTFAVSNSFGQVQTRGVVPAQSHHPKILSPVSLSMYNNPSRQQQQQQQQQHHHLVQKQNYKQ